MSKRRELEERQRAQTRSRNIQLAAILGGIAVVVIGGGILLNQFLGNPSRSNSILPSIKSISKPVPANADNVAAAYGPKEAPIKIEEFIDYQCPACGAQWRANEQGLIEAFAKGGKVRYEFRAMPWVGTTESIDAAQASYCAGDQNKFFEMHDTLFANQLITGEENIGNFSKARLKEMAATVPGIEAGAFASCLDNDKYAQRAQDNRNDFEQRLKAAGQQAGTPSFFINGKLFPNARSAADMKQAIAQVAPDVKLD
jgi:protein-disulfide isomerase